MFHLLITRCLKVKISLPLRLALGAFESNFEPGDRTLKKAILKKVKSSGGFPVGGEGRRGRKVEASNESTHHCLLLFAPSS